MCTDWVIMYSPIIIWSLPDTGRWDWAASLFRASSASLDLHFESRARHCCCRGFEGKRWVPRLHFPPCNTRTSGIPRPQQWAPSPRSSPRLWTPQGDSTTEHSGNNLHRKAELWTCWFGVDVSLCTSCFLESMRSHKVTNDNSFSIYCRICASSSNIATFRNTSASGVCIRRGRLPPSVPRVWSVAGPEELAGWDVPVIRLQLKSADDRGSRPQREPWKVHSLSAGQEPFTLLDTMTSSMAMLPSVPPTTASIMNWRPTHIHLRVGSRQRCLSWNTLFRKPKSYLMQKHFNLLWDDDQKKH